MMLAQAAAGKLGIDPSRVAMADGRVFDAEDPEKGMAFPEAVALAESKFGTLGTVGSYSPPPSAGRYRGAGVGPSPAYSYSAAVVEVNTRVFAGQTPRRNTRLPIDKSSVNAPSPTAIVAPSWATASAAPIVANGRSRLPSIAPEAVATT